MVWSVEKAIRSVVHYFERLVILFRFLLFFEALPSTFFTFYR